MKQFTSVNDVANVSELVKNALECKKHPYDSKALGKNKTLGVIFLNPSLRTRLSTQKAAQNLGMNVLMMNFSNEGWGLETGDGVIMESGPGEHIKEAAAVIAQYCDIIGIRSFPGLEDRELDYSEHILNKFIQYAKKPIISLESATRHPLQSLADLITITELTEKSAKRPKVVLTWAPHPKRLPQAVPNSFAEWMNAADVDFVITHPKGYELAPEFVGNAQVIYDQDEALKDADFVYAKNWSSYTNYGEILCSDKSWMITEQKMALTANGKFMHCLPVRHNVIVEDAVIDGPNSIVINQAENRVYSCQAVLKEILQTL